MSALSPEAFYQAIKEGAVPVDLRPTRVAAMRHIPGSVFVQFRRHDLGKKAASLLDPNRTYVLVVEPALLGPIAEEAFDQGGLPVQGYLEGGLAAWLERGLSTESLKTVDVAALAERLGSGRVDVLDVREPDEYDYGHVRGARLLPHEEVSDRMGDLDRRRRWHVMCNTQTRAGYAASMLKRSGFEDVTLVLGGATAWLEEGYPLERTS